MNEIDIYIDESNTSGKKWEKSKTKIISSGFYIYDKQDNIWDTNFLYDEEIKGSSLMTKKNNIKLNEVLKELIKLRRIGFIAHNKNIYNLLNGLYEVFYPEWAIVDLPLKLQIIIEKIRSKLLIYSNEHNWKFMGKPLEMTLHNWEKYKNEIYNYVLISDEFSNKECKDLYEYFELSKDFLKSIMNDDIYGVDSYERDRGSHLAVIMHAIQAIRERYGEYIRLNVYIDDFQGLTTLKKNIKKISKLIPNISVNYIESSNKKIQVADWVASIFRKSLQETLECLEIRGTEYYVKEESIKTLNFHLDKIKLIDNMFFSQLQLQSSQIGFIGVLQRYKQIDSRINKNLSANIERRVNKWKDNSIYNQKFMKF